MMSAVIKWDDLRVGLGWIGFGLRKIIVLFTLESVMVSRSG